MRTFLKLCGLCLYLLAVSVSGIAGSRVEFTDNRLKVDGKPFFFYGCWGTPNKDYTEYKRRHFNTAFMTPATALRDGVKAAQSGLMVMVYPHAPGWNQKMKDAVQSLVDKTWILAWNIGDDLLDPKHLEAAVKVRDEIRSMDPYKRPIALDAIGRYDEFAKIPDMWCAYAYPLVRPAFDARSWGKPAGLSQYGEWLNAMRLKGRPDCFFWTWAQCHVQVWYNMEYLGGKDEATGAKADEVWKPSLFPDGDHLRLIAAHAISAGCRGLLWFVCYYFQDDRLGRDRYARAAIIGCEFDVLGPLIAQGRTAERLKTSDPTVWATPIDFPGGRLICLLKTGDHYHYQPDAGVAHDVRIETGAPGRVFQIGAEFKELSHPQCTVELTNWLLVTQDESLVNELGKRHQAVLPDMASFAIEELEARIAKTEPVFNELKQQQAAIQEAQQKLSQSREALAQKKWGRVCSLSEEGLRILRTAQHHVWHQIWTPEVTAAGLKMTDFYLLPRFVKEIRALKDEAWGPNQLANGSFETEFGWSGAKMSHDGKGKAGFVSEAAHSGKRSLRLFSDALPIYQGTERDWVTVHLVSEKIPAKSGEVWEIAAWVRVPKRLEKTERGVIISLFVYDNQGTVIPNIGGQYNEARHVEATADWKRLRIVLPLRATRVASIAARVALCGIGEAFVDDVTVRRLVVKE